MRLSAKSRTLSDSAMQMNRNVTAPMGFNTTRRKLQDQLVPTTVINVRHPLKRGFTEE